MRCMSFSCLIFIVIAVILYGLLGYSAKFTIFQVFILSIFIIRRLNKSRVSNNNEWYYAWYYYFSGWYIHVFLAEIRIKDFFHVILQISNRFSLLILYNYYKYIIIYIFLYNNVDEILLSIK